MKKFKRMATAVAALAMTAALALPMTAMVSMPTSAATITVGTDDTRTYKAYQIFAGTLPDATSDTSKALQVTGWGANVNTAGLIAALQQLTVGETATPFAAVTDAASVADVLAKAETDDADVLKAFAAFIADYLTEGDPITSNKNVLNINTIGYYLVEETTGDPITNGAKTRYLLQVVNTAGEQTIDTKSTYPTVDKQVSDEEQNTDVTGTGDDNSTNLKPGESAGDYGYWYESADHEIGETFQFKLTAQLPENDEIDEYKYYSLEFEDSWSEGVTFDGNVKISIGNTTIEFDYDEPIASGDKVTYSAKDSSGATIVVDTKNRTLNVKIPNLKDVTGVTKLNNLKVEVTYDAHLNEKAEVERVSGETSNENKVKLNYSNNPNVKQDGEGNSTGTTPEDSVWVFTYEIDNKKTDNTDKVLAGAQFELHRGGAVTETPIVFLKGDNNKYYVTSYASVEEAEKADGDNAGKFVTVIETTADGLFNFVGLDAGTYTLHEAKAPNGYKAGDDYTITITGQHKENKPGETGAKNNVDLTINYKQGEGAGDDLVTSQTQLDANPVLTIRNSPASNLPGTGGIGTTIFYVVGGTLVVGAGVTLITKKRMKKEEE